ncbi:MAG TPA: ankyrin repeat domain-containing protein [Polyangiaceae bacterium]|nr:ankyrin repeat domain-containing protein [Polyangiaceae bacterium]
MTLALIAGDLPRVRALVAEGTDVNQPDSHGWSPLHRAAVNNRGRAIACLLDAGAQLEARGNAGWTPLHLGCVSCSPNAVSALVAGGADVNAVARNGDTPLHLALVIVVGKEHPELRRASLRAARRILHTLLEAGADALARDGKGQTPAEAARETGAPTLAELLERAKSGRRSARRRAPRSG